MKIMTKDGMDVTNSASRGSKTKEQRDHAHLMRIIKACDSCRKKKIRCDPSHKKRGVAQAATPVPATASRTAKPRTSPPPPPPSEPQSVSVSPLSSDFTLDTPLFEFDQAFTFDNLESFDPAVAGTTDLWDEFLQFPPMDFTGDGMEAFVDPAYLSSQPSSDVSASGSASPVQLGGAPPGLADDRYAEPRVRSPESGVFAIPGSGSAGGDYADFNLYSPGSSFSEDERMLEVSSSSTSVRGLSTPSSSSGLSPSSGAIVDSYEQLATNRRDVHGLESDEQGVQTADARALENHNPQLQTHSATLARLEQLASQSNDIAVSTNASGQLVICCPPGTVVLTSPGTSGDGQNVSLLWYPGNYTQKLIPRKVSSSSNVSASDSSSRRVLVRTVWFPYIDVALLTLIQETIPADLQPSANVDLQLAEQWHRNTDSVCLCDDDLLSTSLLTAKKVTSQPGSSAFSPETGGALAVASSAALLTEIRQASSSVASANLFLQKLNDTVALVAESPGETQVISPVSLAPAGEEEPGVRSSTIASDGSSASSGMRFTHGSTRSSVSSVSASSAAAYDSEYLSVVHSEPLPTAAPVYNLAIPMIMDVLSSTMASQSMRRPIMSLPHQTSPLDAPSQPTDPTSSVFPVASSVASCISSATSTSSASPITSNTAIQSPTQRSSDTGTSLEDGQLATIMSHAINSVLLATAGSVLSDLARWHSDGAFVRSAQRIRRVAPRSRSLAAYHAVPVSVC